MLRPVMFIGCGGSGTKAVRYVRDAVLRRLRHRGWDQPMPDSWQFIGLDTLTFQESPAEIPTMPAEDFLTLSANFDSYRGLHHALEQTHPPRGTPRSARTLCGWLPDPLSVNIPLKDGAGQNRGIGRAAGLLSVEGRVLQRIQEGFARTSSGGPQLRELEACLGADSELGGGSAAPLVTVVSSMAGGTGAGVVLDILDLLRACNPQGGHPTLVLFTNDIFDLPDPHPMAANALGLMSETLAAYWSRPGEIEPQVATRLVQDPGTGPHSIFLVGRYSHGGADLGDTAEVYRAAGEALSTWVLDDAVQERIHNFINVNWRNSAKSNHGGYPFAREHQFGAVSSFGAAKVTVGRDRFAQWAEHLLARGALEGLAAGHLRLGRFTGGSSAEIEAEQVQALAKRFAPRIHRGELDAAPGEESPHGCSAAAAAFASDEGADAFRARARDELALPGGQSADGAQWAQQLRVRGTKAAERVRASGSHGADADWCQRMVAATCRSASETAALSSLRVASEALGAAASQLVPESVRQARSEAELARGEYETRVRAALEGLAKVKAAVAGDAAPVRVAVDEVAAGLAWLWRSVRLDAAADTMEAAAEQVFGALRGAVESARREVAEALKDDAVKAWPSGVADIAQRYLPSAVELPLEPHDRWPDLLGDLCSEARADVAYGSLPSDPVRYRLIAGDNDIAPLIGPHRHHRWHPGQHAEVRCHASAGAVVARVQEWTARPGSRFARTVAEGLRSYLSEADPVTGERRSDHAARMAAFREQLGNAKQASDPLVRVDTGLYEITNSVKLKPFLTLCSQFPFGPGHPADEAARSIVGEASYATSVQDTSSVLVSSYINSPLFPMSIRSFSEPIAAALQATPTREQRSSQFWMWRRSRTLDAFVPMPRDALKAVVSGFAVARMCGYISVDPTVPVRMTGDPGANGSAAVVEFPWPLLTQLHDHQDLLGALLEAFSLTFGTVGKDGVDVYEPYHRLHRLGERALRGRVPADLQHLLETGRPPCPVLEGETPRVSGGTHDERRASAVGYLEANLRRFRSLHPDRMAQQMMRGLDGYAAAGAMTTELAPLCIECYTLLSDVISSQESAFVL